MRGFGAGLWLLAVLVLVAGCGVHSRQALEPGHALQVGQALGSTSGRLPAELADRILQLNPTNVTAQEVRDVLARAPAPRVINIHGGIAWVIARMESFSEFLIGMGYPAVSLTNPSDGTYSFSCYESSAKIAGVIAWYYEREGLRPMLNGHSQGGMQVVKVLHLLASASPDELEVWNPLTWQPEDRCEILDPLTGKQRPVAGLRLGYATAVGAGGLTRALPNQWDMTGRLREIPDTVEEFTGFCKKMDLLGGDFLGYGPANHYQAVGQAVVRNVWLPTHYKHGSVPDTRHLLGNQGVRAWLDAYRPTQETVARPEADLDLEEGDRENLLWAAEVWFYIKKHWVLELQRYIRAQHDRRHDA